MPKETEVNTESSSDEATTATCATEPLSEVLSRVKSDELEVNDVVVVSGINGPKYSMDSKKSEVIIAEQIIVVLEKLSSLKTKSYTITEDDLNLICEQIFKRRTLEVKLSDLDPTAQELIDVKKELSIFGRTREERTKFMEDMEQLVLDSNIKTEQGFEAALAYAKNKTLGITFDKIIGTIMDEARNMLNVDPNVSVDDLASFVATACFHGKTIDLLGKAIINCNGNNMKPFLRQCLSHLSIVFKNEGGMMDNNFSTECWQLMSDVIMKQLL